MRSLIQYLYSFIFHLLPETRCFSFKRFMLRLAGVNVGRNVKICSSVTILGAGRLTIGDNTWIGHDVMICASNNVTIGSNCDIAPRVYIGDGTHEITPKHERIAGIDTTYPIKIGNGCWICANATILPGVEIGNKCVVAAGAVVLKSIHEDLALIAGIPAQIRRKL